MSKNNIELLDEKNDFIEGIYNYCDRWCERCAFTKRCMDYAINQSQFDDFDELIGSDASDFDSLFHKEELEHQLFDSLQTTIELLQDIAEERGIDLGTIDLEEIEKEQEKIREEAEENLCAITAESYVDRAERWFEAADPLFMEKGEELLSAIRMNVPGVDAESEALDLCDVIEVIRWYQDFIYVKLVRALRSRANDEDPAEKGWPKDSDGSAKTALIAIDQSISAWSKFMHIFPEQDLETLGILAHLDRLRKMTEKEFPNARDFVRPGFDEAEPIDTELAAYAEIWET